MSRSFSPRSATEHGTGTGRIGPGYTIYSAYPETRYQDEFLLHPLQRFASHLYRIWNEADEPIFMFMLGNGAWNFVFL